MSLQIVNIALNLMGSQSVSSVEDDAWAKVLNDAVPYYYNYLLEEHTWTWAKAFSALNQDTANDNPKYDYSYTLPSNLLRMMNAYYANTTSPNYATRETDYEIINNKLYSNRDYITVEYIVSNFDVELTPQSFKLALAYKILSEISASLMNDPTKLELYTRRAAIEINNAISIDATNNGKIQRFRYPIRYVGMGDNYN